MELELGLRARLVAALERHPEVELALLFGSRARGVARPGSDVDVAVVGHEVDTLGLVVELSDMSGMVADVVDLSIDPPIALLRAVLQDGLKIYEMPSAYGQFLARALTNLETDLPAFRRMQDAFIVRVSQHGLSGGNGAMIATESIRSKLAQLDDRVGRLRTRIHHRVSPEAMASDRDALDLVAFNLMLAVQTTCDLAAHVIAGQGWTAPPTIAKSFHQLAEHQVISPLTAAALQRAVDIRNAIAVGCDRIDLPRLHAVSATALDHLDRFGREVTSWLVRQLGHPATADP